MKMVLIERVHESHLFLMITHFFETMVDPERHSRLTNLGYQNVCLALVILDYNLLQHL
jgi:hypothetical protein